MAIPVSFLFFAHVNATAQWRAGFGLRDIDLVSPIHQEVRVTPGLLDIHPCGMPTEPFECTLFKTNRFFSVRRAGGL
jgi:hypothetical protein